MKEILNKNSNNKVAPKILKYNDPNTHTRLKSQYRTRNGEDDPDNYNNISALNEDINYTDALFIPPLKIRAQLQRISRFTPKPAKISHRIQPHRSLSTIRVPSYR